MSLDEENPLRLSVYRKAIGVECAVIEKADMEGQNGVIHIINRVMIPANISAGDLLRREGNFKYNYLRKFILNAESQTILSESSLLKLNAGRSSKRWNWWNGQRRS
jgi:hypothetical protein